MNKDKRKKAKWIIGVTLTVLVAALYYSVPCDKNDVQNIQNNLISASGILAGILIAFLSTKLIQFADDKNKGKIVLNEYADKLTPFRKLLFRIMKSNDFWVYRTDITKFKAEEPNVTFHTLHGDSEASKSLRQKFWLSEPENPINHTTIDLYLAMEEITGKTNENKFWPYDDNAYYEYDLEYLRRAEMPTNQIWYYLDGRYAKHTVGQINEDGTFAIDRDDMNTLAAAVDPQFKDRQFDRILVAEIATYVYEIVLPEMITITEKRLQPLTKSITSLFLSLIIILVSGVAFPLIWQIANLGDQERLITTICVLTVIISLMTFLVDLVGLATDDEESITDKARIRVLPTQD